MKKGFGFQPGVSVVVILMLMSFSVCLAGEWPKELHIYRGTTPKLDGKLSKGEYDDATLFTSRGWVAQFNPVTDESDVFVQVWAKHDGKNFYFAFKVQDDILYGIDTKRWVPEEFPNVHKLTREGFPWFGDGVELLVNAAYEWSQADGQNNTGSAYSWQMVCNATKSRLGGIGKGGLMEGEERSNIKAWNTYQKWIKEGAMKAAVKVYPKEHYFVIEWMVRPNPCLEVRPGVFWEPGMGVVPMGLNIGVQDADTPEQGVGNFGNFDHEDWWTGEYDKRTWLKQWGTMFVHPGARPREIYVGYGGAESNPGTKEQPLGSFESVKRRIRELTAEDAEQDILVIVQEGTYPVNETLVFDNMTFGEGRRKVTFTVEPGHEWSGQKVTLSGGIRIRGWEKDEKTGLYKAKVPAGLKGGFRQLFMDGRRLTRAKYPNAMNDNFTVKTASEDQKKFTLKEPSGPFDLVGSEMVALHHWSIARGVVESVKEGAIETRTPMGWTGTPWYCLTNPKDRVFFENKLSFLDAEEEWYLDEAEGVVYLMTAEGVNPNGCEVVAPAVTEMVKFAGSKERPVRNVYMRHFDFEYTSWQLPAGGYAGLQAAHTGTGFKTEPTYALPLAFGMEYAENCEVRLCGLRHLGANAIGLGAGCRDNRILGCVIEDAGANGVMVGYRRIEGREPRKWFENDWADPTDAPAKNTVSNCLVRAAGQISFGAVGIWAAFSEGTVLSHNVVTEMPYSGMSVGFRWDTNPTTQKACRVEYNHVFDVMNILADGGAIYMLGYQPDTVLNNNLLHAVHRGDFTHGSFNNGIFFDEGSKGYSVTNNIIFDTNHDPIRFNASKKDEHEWDNNFFGVGPTDLNFPWDRAALAGLEPAYRMKVKAKGTR